MKKYILGIATILLLGFTSFTNANYSITTLPRDEFDPDRVQISYNANGYYGFETLVKTGDFTFFGAGLSKTYTCPSGIQIYDDKIHGCNGGDIIFNLNVSNLIILWSTAPGGLTAMGDFGFLEAPAPIINSNSYSTILDSIALGGITEAGNIASSKIGIIALTFLGFSLFILILNLLYKAFGKKKSKKKIINIKQNE